MAAEPFIKMISIVAALLAVQLQGQENRLTLEVDRAGHPVSPMLYGLMIEEINHSLDGGLYAELVQNRAFHADWSGTPPWDLIRNGSSQATAALDATSWAV